MRRTIDTDSTPGARLRALLVASCLGTLAWGAPQWTLAEEALVQEAPAQEALEGAAYVRLSVKFATRSGTQAVRQEREAGLVAAVREANVVLERSEASWRLTLADAIEVEIPESSLLHVAGRALRELEIAAGGDPATYGWRTDSINIYFLPRTFGRGECSLPSQGDVVVFDEDLQTFSGVLLLHEIGHYLALTHTFECLDGSCLPQRCTGLAALHRGSRGAVACDDTCPDEDNVMSRYWPDAAAARLTPCQLAEIEYELRDSGGHRGAILSRHELGQHELGQNELGQNELGQHELGQHEPQGQVAFRRGDIDGSGALQITDALRVLDALFVGGAELLCADAADVDDDGSLQLADPVYLLNFLYLGGPFPAAPHGVCGRDSTVDRLGCLGGAACR